MALPKESAELGCRVFSTVQASDYVFQPGVLYSCEHIILNDLHFIKRRWQLYRAPSVASDLIIQTGHEGEFLYRRQRVPLYYRRAAMKFRATPDTGAVGLTLSRDKAPPSTGEARAERRRAG